MQMARSRFQSHQTQSSVPCMLPMPPTQDLEYSAYNKHPRKYLSRGSFKVSRSTCFSAEHGPAQLGLLSTGCGSHFNKRPSTSSGLKSAPMRNLKNLRAWIKFFALFLLLGPQVLQQLPLLEWPRFCHLPM